MKREQTEGITLRSVDFKERQRILTLFTEERGLTTLIIKGISQKKPHLMTVSTPFCIADFHYLRGRSNIHTFQDATIKESLSSLKKTFAHLTAAAEIASSILHSQLPEKTAPSLYYLLKAYFLHLHSFEDPTIAVVSFSLKLLLHEGLLSLSNPPPQFTNEEWKSLLPLALAKHFSVIPQNPIANTLATKLKTYAQSVINR